MSTELLEAVRKRLREAVPEWAPELREIVARIDAGGFDAKPKTYLDGWCDALDVLDRCWEEDPEVRATFAAGWVATHAAKHGDHPYLTERAERCRSGERRSKTTREAVAVWPGQIVRSTSLHDRGRRYVVRSTNGVIYQPVDAARGDETDALTFGSFVMNFESENGEPLEERRGRPDPSPDPAVASGALMRSFVAIEARNAIGAPPERARVEQIPGSAFIVSLRYESGRVELAIVDDLQEVAELQVNANGGLSGLLAVSVFARIG